MTAATRSRSTAAAGAEQFTTTANGTRVRFDRLNPAPFSIDIGTSERLTLNANGGDDSFSATGNLAALIAITADGGFGNDTLLGSNGIDLLLGGDGNDFADGQQGNDTALLGAGDDAFQWDPGDGNDAVEGQDGTDAMAFNGSNISENMDVSANGQRVQFRRDIAAITMDLNDIEFIVAKTLGGTDNLTINDLSGTDVINVVADLAATGGGDDAQPDKVIANATNGDDVVTVTGAGPSARSAVSLPWSQCPAPSPAATESPSTRWPAPTWSTPPRSPPPRHCSPSTEATATTCSSAVMAATPSTAALATTCSSAGPAPTPSTVGSATMSSSTAWPPTQ